MRLLYQPALVVLAVVGTGSCAGGLRARASAGRQPEPAAGSEGRPECPRRRGQRLVTTVFRRSSPLLIAALAAGAAISAAAAAAPMPMRPSGAAFPTTRTFNLGPGHVERRFTLRERSGVILLSRITVRRGVRAYVDATIPHVAGARVSTPRANDPALVCTTHGVDEVCTQSQEWCPMPAALWRLHLVKLSGPAGPVRVDYVVAPPPTKG